MKKLIIAATFASLAFAASAETIHFATEASYAPFEFINEKNQIVGFDIDLANALCNQIKAECTFANQAFDSLIPGLKFRRFDAVIASMDITPERAQQVTFTHPYYKNSAIFIVPKAKFSRIGQLKGKRVGVQNGSTHQKYLLEKHPEINVVNYDSYQNSVLDLKNGRIDAIFCDSAVGHEWLKKETQLAVVGDKVTDENYFGQGLAIALRHGNTELADKFNQALATIKQNGTYDTIYKKWFE